MSRGLGGVEREVLGFLRDRCLSGRGAQPARLDLLAELLQRHPESVRRALKSLERKGMLVLGRDNGLRILDDGSVLRFYETTCPTAVLSVEHCSTLTGN